MQMVVLMMPVGYPFMFGGKEYGSILATLALEREKLLTEGSPSTYNNQILRSHARELINELTEHKERVP